MPAIVVGLALLLGLAAPSTADAAPITGSFSKFGNFLPVISATGVVTTLDQATGIDFIALFGSTPTPGVDGQFLVNSATGDFASLIGMVGSARDFTFAGAGNAAFPNLPMPGFETVGGLTFDLLTDVIVMRTASVLVLNGTGVFHMSGFDATPGEFTFTGNGAGGTFSFSASQGAVAVPEPVSMVFLASGLMIGAAVLRRARPSIRKDRLPSTDPTGKSASLPGNQTLV